MQEHKNPDNREERAREVHGEREDRWIALLGVLGANFVPHYDPRDLLANTAIGIVGALGKISIELFPLKSNDELWEELFKPILAKEVPNLKCENPSDESRLSKLIGAADCCATAIRLGDRNRLRTRDKAWYKAIEAISYWVEIGDEKQSFSFSSIGKKGAVKRHAPMRKLKAFALGKFRAKEWRSANKAAHELKAEVMGYGRTIGAHLTEENAQRTIADWFRKAGKSV